MRSGRPMATFASALSGFALRSRSAWRLAYRIVKSSLWTVTAHLLMNLCSLPTIARMNPKNLIHLVFDNEVYEASGSKKTATGAGADLVGMAYAAGIKNAHWASSPQEFEELMRAAMAGDGLCFIGAKTNTERVEVPPYPIDEVENKYRFLRHVEKTEGIEILRSKLPASYN